MFKMRKSFIFLIFLVIALVSIIAVIFVGYYLFNTPPQSFLQGMMGGGTSSSGLNPTLIIIFVVLIIVIFVSIGGLVYFLVLPEIKTSNLVKKTDVEVLHEHPLDSKSTVKPYETVIKDLTKDEQKVLDILVANDGKCSLEYLRKESGLTSVKIHRLVAHLASKGIVLVGKSENKNEVQLTNWLHITTGYDELDNLILGGIPQGYAVMLASSFSDERQLLVKRFLEVGVESEQITFYITSDPGGLKGLAEKAPFDFYLFVCNPRADVIVKNLPNVFKLKGLENLTDIEIALTKAFRLIESTHKGPKRACIEILSDVLLEHHSVVTRKWLSGVIQELRANGFTTLAVVNPQMHSSEELEAITGLFEGDIRITERETNNGIVKLLKVKKMYNQRYLENEIVIVKEKLMH